VRIAGAVDRPSAGGGKAFDICCTLICGAAAAAQNTQSLNGCRSRHADWERRAARGKSGGRCTAMHGAKPNSVEVEQARTIATRHNCTRETCTNRGEAGRT
jgi:hypothetical protein